jgi:hypothetical protein
MTTKSSKLTDEQIAARKNRWWEIRNRISSSGEVSDPTEADQLADDIEAWEFGDGNETERQQRNHMLRPMMSGGYVKMRDILTQAKKSWERKFTFDDPA